MTTQISTLISEIEACRYECEAGALENNIAWIELKAAISLPITPVDPVEAFAQLREKFGDSFDNVQSYTAIAFGHTSVLSTALPLIEAFAKMRFGDLPSAAAMEENQP